jgi:L-ascorbate metabolism protein UlaG (beta-lactamase superfamily)
MMCIRWWGHACFEISNGTVLVIDPHDGISIGIPPPKTKADIVLVTHDHFDHNQTRVVEKEGTHVVYGEADIDGITVRTVAGYHDREDGARRGSITIFVVEYHGITLCHLGDLGHVIDNAMVDAIGDVDVLFVPVGGVFTLDAREALEVCRRVRTKVIVPMHYKIEGLSLPIEGVDAFLAAAAYETRYVANEIDIETDDLPQEKEVWVFSL